MIPGVSTIDKDLYENLEWVTQKTRHYKDPKGNLTFPTHAVNMSEL